MEFKEETTERNDKNNWVKKRLLNDNKFKIISFEGYTIKNNCVTALFDLIKMRLYKKLQRQNKRQLQLLRM